MALLYNHADAQQVTPTTFDSVAKVYFIKNINHALIGKDRLNYDFPETMGEAAKACTDHGRVHLEEPMASRNATHLLDYTEQMGIGTRKYVLITIE